MPTDAQTVQDADVEPIFSIGTWATNAEMIDHVRRLGYLQLTDRVLDMTYGEGNFWTVYRHPEELFVGIDAVPHKSPYGAPVDFRDTPFEDQEFDVVFYDAPYKLNGTPDPEVDERYGVHERSDWVDRMQLIFDGALEAGRLARRFVIAKVSDQVCSGAVRWQVDLITRALDAEPYIDEDGLYVPNPQHQAWRKADRLDYMSYREQPAGRRQVHARSNSSQLVIYERRARHRIKR